VAVEEWVALKDQELVLIDQVPLAVLLVSLEV
jgi:hypothetical protein